jgi:hypothetical protein
VSAFFDHSQAEFYKKLTEGAQISAELEQSHTELSQLVDNILELGLRIRSLRSYCLRHAIPCEGKMMVDAERVIQILDGG